MILHALLEDILSCQYEFSKSEEAIKFLTSFPADTVYTTMGSLDHSKLDNFRSVFVAFTSLLPNNNQLFPFIFVASLCKKASWSYSRTELFREFLVCQNFGREVSPFLDTLSKIKTEFKLGPAFGPCIQYCLENNDLISIGKLNKGNFRFKIPISAFSVFKRPFIVNTLAALAREFPLNVYGRIFDGLNLNDVLSKDSVIFNMLCLDRIPAKCIRGNKLGEDLSVYFPKSNQVDIDLLVKEFDVPFIDHLRKGSFSYMDNNLIYDNLNKMDLSKEHNIESYVFIVDYLIQCHFHWQSADKVKLLGNFSHDNPFCQLMKITKGLFDAEKIEQCVVTWPINACFSANLELALNCVEWFDAIVSLMIQCNIPVHFDPGHPGFKETLEALNNEEVKELLAIEDLQPCSYTTLPDIDISAVISGFAGASPGVVTEALENMTVSELEDLLKYLRFCNEDNCPLTVSEKNLLEEIHFVGLCLKYTLGQDSIAQFKAFTTNHDSDMKLAHRILDFVTSSKCFKRLQPVSTLLIPHMLKQQLFSFFNGYYIRDLKISIYDLPFSVRSYVANSLQCLSIKYPQRCYHDWFHKLMEQVFANDDIATFLSLNLSCDPILFESYPKSTISEYLTTKIHRPVSLQAVEDLDSDNRPEMDSTRSQLRYAETVLGPLDLSTDADIQTYVYNAKGMKRYLNLYERENLVLFAGDFSKDNLFCKCASLFQGFFEEEYDLYLYSNVAVMCNENLRDMVRISVDVSLVMKFMMEHEIPFYPDPEDDQDVKRIMALQEKSEIHAQFCQYVQTHTVLPLGDVTSRNDIVSVQQLMSCSSKQISFAFTHLTENDKIEISAICQQESLPAFDQVSKKKKLEMDLVS